MNDPLDMIPSDNDSTDSESEVDTTCCRIFICSRSSTEAAPEKQSVEKVHTYTMNNNNSYNNRLLKAAMTQLRTSHTYSENDDEVKFIS